MKLKHWGKSKINIGLGKRKDADLQTSLLGTVCAWACVCSLFKGDTACTSFQVGTQRARTKRIKPHRQQVESVLLPLSSLARPLSLCFRDLKTALELPGGCSQPSSSIHSQGWLPNLLLTLPTWPLAMNTGCPYCHYLRDALMASLSAQPSNNQSIERWL